VLCGEHLENSNFLKKYGKITYRKLDMRIVILQPYEGVVSTTKNALKLDAQGMNYKDLTVEHQ
jgi:uncharacterized protein YlbG (UPF0298 family)